jgi:hypothetical protein
MLMKTLKLGLSAVLMSCLGFAGCASFDWEPAPVPGVMMPPPLDPYADSDADALMGDDDDDDDAGPSLSLSDKIKQFAPVTITADISGLPANEKAALDKIIEASKLLDPIFNRQAYAKYPELEKTLSGDKLTYFHIMRGPWDRQDHHKPFAIDIPRPKGAGFYPEDLTAAELDAYIEKHPNQKKRLLGLFTVVERRGNKLVAIPYAQHYRKWLRPAAQKLREAATVTKNKSLKRFLRARAAAFLSDQYYQSDVAWMDLDSQVEVTIGPYENYEDRLKGAKTAYESFVTVADPTASGKLAKYKALLPSMEENLPVPDAVKNKRGKKSPIRVVDLVFASGDARKSVQTIAFNLPNDEKVREEKGSKKVLLRNVINAKYDRLLKPIALRVMNKKHHKHITRDGFFNEVLFHELSHALGPGKIEVGGKTMEVREALQETYSALEECKADVMGAHNVLFMIKQKEFPASFRPDILTTYFAGLFRSVRFGVAEAHGKGAALQINYHLKSGAAKYDAKRKTFTIDLNKLEKSISDLTRDLVMVQHKGNKAAAIAMLDKYAIMSAPMAAVLKKLSDLPIDLRPTYPLAK